MLLDTVTLTNSGQAYKLLDLLAAAQQHVITIELQLDIDAGAAKLYIGTSGVSPSHWGAKLVSGQAWAPPTALGAFDLSQIYLYTDTPGVAVGVFLK